MKLSRVARYFNNTKFSDAYSGVALGVGQLEPYDDSRRDGLTAQRRIFEMAPDVPLPPRLVIEFHGMQWLVGVTEIDSFKGSVIREKHVLHQAEDLAQVHTMKSLLEGSAAHEAYAARVWVKSTSEVEISSQKYNQLNIFFSRAEDIRPDTLVQVSGRLHTVMAVYPAAAGHLIAISEELDEGAVEDGFSKGEWDPRREEYVGADEPIKLVKLRWQTDFSYYSLNTPDFDRGDMQAAALNDHAPGTEITLADGLWRVVASQQRNDVYYLHMRRA